MSSLTTAIRDEINRLARRQIRQEIDGLKKTLARCRSEIVELKRQCAALEKSARQEAAHAARAAATRLPPPAAAADTVGAGEGVRRRFSAKAFKVRRLKLGLSGADTARLLQVSGQSIYNWESGTSRPKPAQLVAIRMLFGAGKREIRRRLDALSEGAAG